MPTGEEIIVRKSNTVSKGDTRENKYKQCIVKTLNIKTLQSLEKNQLFIKFLPFFAKTNKNHYNALIYYKFFKLLLLPLS